MDPLSQYLDKVKNHHTGAYGSYLNLSTDLVPKKFTTVMMIQFVAMVFVILILIAGTIFEIIHGQGINVERVLLGVSILGIFALFLSFYLLIKAVKKFLFLRMLRSRRKHHTYG